MALHDGPVDPIKLPVMVFGSADIPKALFHMRNMDTAVDHYYSFLQVGMVARTPNRNMVYINVSDTAEMEPYDNWQTIQVTKAMLPDLIEALQSMLHRFNLSDENR